MEIEGFGRKWQWDEADVETGVRSQIFGRAKEFDTALNTHCPLHRVCIQAGGNFGVYPWVAGGYFDRVYTFEPDPVCYRLLRDNLVDRPNVAALPYALGRRAGTGTIETDKPHNRGCQWVQPAVGGPVTIISIDDLELADVDYIQLDIEGAEMEALAGAVETIERCRPTIQLEHKDLGKRFGHERNDTVDWLAKRYDYKVVWRPARDVVLVAA